MSRARRLDAHRRLLRRPSRRQRHRRRRRADRHRRGLGQPLLRRQGRGVLFRRGWRVRQRRRARIFKFRRPGPVRQPLRQRARLRPADHFPGLQQPLRHDGPRRRRGDGRQPLGAARRGVRRQPDARRGRQRHERIGRARRRPAGREALPRRQGTGSDRGRLLSLLGPFAERSAQRVSHQGGGGGLEGARPHRDLQEGIERRRRSGSRGDRRGG